MDERCLQFLLVYLIAVNCQQVVTQDCQANNAARIRFAFRSETNATGHRQLKGTVERSISPGPNSDMGHLEATHDILNCHGTEIIKTEFLITDGNVIIPDNRRANLPPKIHPPDYELIPGVGYYKKHLDAVTWPDAFEICHREGGHLIVVNSETEAGIVKDFMTENPNVADSTYKSWAWVGFHDRGEEEDYRTVLGTPLKDSGYEKWKRDDATGPTENCGLMNEIGLIATDPCLNKEPFICEQPI